MKAKFTISQYVKNDRKEYILSARLDDDTIPANPEP